MKYLKKFNENFEESSEIKKIDLYYERWMKEFDIVQDYKGKGPGTIFGGDSGYLDTYEELVSKLKDEIDGDDVVYCLFLGSVE